jgi:hypothetical protein
MAARTTVAEVKLIIETTLTDPSIQAFINGASLHVTQVLSTTLSEEVLTEIEKWLTAHMIASTRERMAKSEEAGGAKISYLGKDGTGLEQTPYGQMVLSLDTTGAFKLLEGKRKNVSFMAIAQEGE